MERPAILALTERWLHAVIAQPELFEQLVIGDATPFRLRAAELRAAFSQLQPTLEELLVEGDRVAWRWSVSGTHVADFAGIAATQRRVTLRGVNFQRLEHGRVAEHWTLVDLQSLR
jgi:predicted ester cyclase